MSPVGVGVLNLVDPGVVTAAEALTRVDGVLPKWQVSHCALMGDGICPVVPDVVAGNTTIAVMPLNELPEMPLPWQALHPVVMPLWLNLPAAKVALVLPILDNPVGMVV